MQIHLEKIQQKPLSSRKEMLKKLINNSKKIVAIYGIPLIFGSFILHLSMPFFVPEENLEFFRNGLVAIVVFVPIILLLTILVLVKITPYFYALKKRFYRKKDQATFQKLKTVFVQKGFQEIESKNNRMLLGAVEGLIVLMKVEVQNIWIGVPLVFPIFSKIVLDKYQHLPLISYRKTSASSIQTYEEILSMSLENLQKDLAEFNGLPKRKDPDRQCVFLEEKNVEEAKGILKTKTGFLENPTWIDFPDLS